MLKHMVDNVMSSVIKQSKCPLSGGIHKLFKTYILWCSIMFTNIEKQKKTPGKGLNNWKTHILDVFPSLLFKN